ncbi:helix-turn-helix domain-containing protein [Acinetobacter haemolyticus]|uniref:AraC family transcriptional regulator n=1 Tax=Acinetobacter haemolyticus TaxID=29430 RepID=UPI0013729160|nr:AraC family transcriptional regulator [Acinetobacter haemolyticus]NAR64586.1 helix-turn-helix domain-containing protein [Acinetobacter haemolyticus]
MQGLALRNEDLVSQTLGCRPEVNYINRQTGWQMMRWRQFVGHYHLAALPEPMLVAHIGGKQHVRMRDGQQWSHTRSKPSDMTYMPASIESGWLVDGELDVVTLTLPHVLQEQRLITDVRFAYTDTLGIALIRQMLASLYEPQSLERDQYIDLLMTTVIAHFTRADTQLSDHIPRTTCSAHRLHHILNIIREHPEQEFSLDLLASEINLTPAHFCRMFREATGITPHQYILKCRLERAEHLLTHSDLSISMVAESSGFNSQSHFTRLFLKKMGKNPSDLRRRLH